MNEIQNAETLDAQKQNLRERKSTENSREGQTDKGLSNEGLANEEQLSNEQIKEFLETKPMYIGDAIKLSFRNGPKNYMTVDRKSVVNCVEYILGSPWRVQLVFPDYEVTWVGCCSPELVRILQINGFDVVRKKIGDRFAHLRKVIRHEVIHAYFLETGLWMKSRDVKNWSDNNEMIEWFGHNMPKIEATTESIYEKLKPACEEMLELLEEQKS